MQETSRRRKVLFFIFPILLFLTACEAHGNFAINEDGFGTIKINLKDDTGVMQMANITCDALKSEIALAPGDKNKIEVIDNSTADTYDCTLLMSSDKSLVDNKVLTESDDTFILDFKNNQKIDEQTLSMLSGFKFDFDFTVEMPGKIVRAEGAEIKGNKAVFNDVEVLLTKGITVEGKKFDDGSAKEDIDSDDSDEKDNKIFLLLFLVIIIFLLVSIFLLVIFFGRRKKNRNANKNGAFTNPYNNNSGVNAFNAFSGTDQMQQNQFTPSNNQVPEFFSAPPQQPAAPSVPPAPAPQTENNPSSQQQPKQDTTPDANGPFLKP